MEHKNLTEPVETGPVEKALGVFWKNGVEATSYRDLVAQTGLSRKALYSKWADKSSLVHDTLQLYRERVLESIISLLKTPSMQSLEIFWDTMEASIKDPDWIGCYLFRSASGELREDPVVNKAFNDYIDTLKSNIELSLKAAKLANELPNEIDPATAAWQVVSLLSLMSSFGGQSGYSATVQALIDAGRNTCGIKI